MFFWGSYNFQAPQQVEDPERPPLRYPVYVPPSLAYLAEAKKVPSTAAFEQDVAGAVRVIQQERLYVRHVACGLKHLVAVLEVRAGSGVEQGSNKPSTATWRTSVYGMGSNHHGQLGARVATYTNTLSNLRVEEVLDGGVDDVACGARHTLLCTSTGCVYVSGDNGCGQLGLTPQAMRRAQALAGTSSHTRSATTASTASSTTRTGAAPVVTGFTQLTNLAHIRHVYAAQNASFALDRGGQLYAWGEAQYGHLGHNDTGERVDPHTLKTVTQNVTTPQLVRWFERHRVSVVQVAVGKAHLVCRSETDVYTCGEAVFGKLGHGDIASRLEPTRVSFPPRRQTERLVQIAAGDDHTLVLKDNPDLGAVVYFFGKLGNGDGQLTPLIVPVPDSALRSVVAGRGNLCVAVSTQGKLYVWGRHAYTKVHPATPATAPRQRPSLIEVLEPHRVAGVAVGGTFVVAYAELDSTTSACNAWEVVVPHDYRVNARGEGDVGSDYERGVMAFLRLYYGDALGAAYGATLPVAPPRTAAARYAFARIPAHDLTPGQKVRLWMSDVYALGTVLRVHETDSTADGKVDAAGRRVTIAWERDDWKDEVLTLYSSDETVDGENENRWQPYWFERNEENEFVYVRGR